MPTPLFHAFSAVPSGNTGFYLVYGRVTLSVVLPLIAPLLGKLPNAGLLLGNILLSAVFAAAGLVRLGTETADSYLAISLSLGWLLEGPLMLEFGGIAELYRTATTSRNESNPVLTTTSLNPTERITLAISRTLNGLLAVVVMGKMEDSGTYRQHCTLWPFLEQNYRLFWTFLATLRMLDAMSTAIICLGPLLINLTQNASPSSPHNPTSLAPQVTEARQHAVLSQSRLVTVPHRKGISTQTGCLLIASLISAFIILNVECIRKGRLDVHLISAEICAIVVTVLQIAFVVYKLVSGWKPHESTQPTSVEVAEASTGKAVLPIPSDPEGKASGRQSSLFLPFANRSVANVSELFAVLKRHPWEQVLDGSGRLKSNATSPDVTHLPMISSASIGRIPIHALIIGINAYSSHPLRGSVPDAKAIEEYLKAELKVPKDQITCLYDEQATRSSIIKAYHDLRDNAAIHRGDSIVIFYAGHGTQLNPQPGWEAGGPAAKIQAIIPQDHCDTPGREVPVIPDRTLACLINGVAREKGDNILVVFDSCHSGSGTRTTDMVSRSMAVRDYLPRDLDVNILASDRPTPSGSVGRVGGAVKGYEHTGSASHVLLAACSSTEEARETLRTIDGVNVWRGNFTVALISLLRGGESSRRLTYADIPHRIMPLDRQSPQIEGLNCNRFIFETKERPSLGALLDIELGKDGKYRLNAGIAHAISSGAQFAVYSNREAFEAGAELGTLEVDKDEDVNALSTILSLPTGLPRIELDAPGVAVQTKPGERVDFRLYVEPSEAHSVIFDAVSKEREQDLADRYHVDIVKDRLDAHLELKVTSNAVAINILDNRATAHGLFKIPSLVEAKVDNICAVLRSVAHFYRYFDTITKDRFISKNIKVEFYNLEEDEDDFDDEGYYMFVPVGENLVAEDGTIQLLVDDDAKFGLKITNNTPRDLYPYVFLFENGDFSISPYYMSQSGTGNRTKVDPPLMKDGGSLTIGYGSGGGRPHKFSLRQNQDLDLSFLRLLFATKPIDLSAIPQASPFGHRSFRRAKAVVDVDAVGLVCIPIVQRRYPKSNGV